MMGLWWMRPEWKQTSCARCGRNIWDSGGDPDHGVCLECWEAAWSPPQYRLCDVCGKGEAVAGVAGLGVCSQTCADEAERRAAKKGKA
jgi:hypothetical protein